MKENPSETIAVITEQAYIVSGLMTRKKNKNVVFTIQEVVKAAQNIQIGKRVFYSQNQRGHSVRGGTSCAKDSEAVNNQTL